ncbi:MAG: GNAT family N-acetyltransferase [Chitinophagales bacterium]|nr:GNAT family N-acetyltransferase [Chitinophagales bacterium]
MKVQLVLHDSKDYWSLVKLRSEILRKPLGLEFSKEELALENKQLHFGIFEGEDPLACMSLVLENQGEVKMRQVAVAQAAQGKALGSLLLKEVEAFIKEKAYTVIHCHARASAINFYLKNGYQIRGEEFTEVGLAHYYMWKML